MMYAYLCMYICILFADVCVCVRIQFTVHPPSNFLFFLFCRLRVFDSEATGLAPLSADPRAAPDVPWRVQITRQFILSRN